MKCLRSGYCCVHYDVIILVDPDKGIVEGNVVHKSTGEKCMHLKGSEPGFHSCAIHNHPNYKETPCFAFTQIEKGNTNCRLGERVISINKQLKEE